MFHLKMVPSKNGLFCSDVDAVTIISDNCLLNLVIALRDYRSAGWKFLCIGPVFIEDKDGFIVPESDFPK